MRSLRPDLIVLTYGLNLAALPWPPGKGYGRGAVAMIKRLRAAAGDAACLVTSPYPVGFPKADGSFNPEAKSARVVSDFQRQAAKEAGCVFLDRFRLAGGRKAARRWVAAHPRILSGDYQHLTKHGAELMGRGIANVILSSYDGGVFGSNADLALEKKR